MKSLRRDESGQGHTLEAVAAAFLLLASIGFALQMTAVTPLSASTSSQHLENQLQFSGAGALSAVQTTGGVSEAIRYWDNDTGEFHNVGDDRYYTGESPDNGFRTTLGRTLERIYDDRNIAYNVYVFYESEGDGTVRRPIIFRGEPTDHAVSTSFTVTLMDEDPLIDEDESPNSSDTISDTNTNYFIPESRTSSPVHNVVEVEVVAWRI